MEDVWVWDKNRPTRIIPRAEIYTSSDVTVEELRGEGDEPGLTAEALAERIGESLRPTTTSSPASRRGRRAFARYVVEGGRFARSSCASLAARGPRRNESSESGASRRNAVAAAASRR